MWLGKIKTSIHLIDNARHETWETGWGTDGKPQVISCLGVGIELAVVAAQWSAVVEAASQRLI